MKHVGNRNNVKYTDGTNIMDVSFRVTDPECHFPLISVAERLDRGQMVLFGPRVCRIIKDDHNIHFIEEIANGVTGINIERYNNKFTLAASLLEKSDSDYLGNPVPRAPTDVGNHGPYNADSSFVVTKPSVHPSRPVAPPSSDVGNHSPVPSSVPLPQVIKNDTFNKGLSKALEEVEKEAEVDRVVEKQRQTEIQVDVPVKLPKAPYEPTEAEIELHEARGHVPYRSWCSGCVAGRCPDSRHERNTDVSHNPDFVVPTIEFDYATPHGKTSDPDSKVPFLSASESEHGAIHATFIRSWNLSSVMTLHKATLPNGTASPL